MKNEQRLRHNLHAQPSLHNDISRLRPQPCLRMRVIVVALAAAMVVVPLMLTGVSAEAVAKSGRKRKSVTIQTVQCGCGANLSRELMVEPTADKDCTRVKLRRPHELRGSGLERYPLRARFRRTSEGSEIHMHWRLTYMPRRKRSRLSEFHLLFMTTATRKSRRGQENTQCFRVSGLRQVCKRKVTCKVRYPKKRARGLSLQVLYRYRKGQKVRGQKSTKVKGERSPGFSYVLKSSLTRRTKRRETRRGKSGSPQKKKNKPRRRMLTLYRLRQTSQEDPSRSDPAENCAAWIPKLTLSSQNDRVTVTITPVNPFASELELALHYRASSLQINPVRISARKETYTFINVSKGIYRVSLRAHGPHCSNLDYIFSRSLVSVTGEENSSRSKRHKECKNWRPTIDLSASGRSVTARYSPANHLASSLEIVLQRPGSSLVLYAKNISNSVTTYTFTDVDEGNYRMAILALGNKCRGADYIFSKQSVIVKDNVQGPICSEWKPSTFLARVIQESGSWCVVEVNLNIPSYLSAKKVEVGLQEPQSEEIVKLHSLRLAETSAVFNITKGKNNYKVVVRPYGCTDCKDFQDHGEECFLPFNTANSAMSCGNASWPLSNAGTSPVSTPPTTTSMTTTKTTTTTNRETRNNQTQTRENRNLTTTPRLTERDPPGSNTRPLTPSKLEHNPSTRYIQLVRVLLYLGGVAVLIVAVAATVMWLLGKRRQRRAVDRPGNAEAAPEMEQLRTSDDVDTEPKVPFSNSPDPNPPPNNYLLEYEINNRTEPKLPHYFPTQRSFSSRVLVIHECRKPSDKDVLDRFLDVIKKCLPHKNVRVDFECRRENARNVEEWARGELRCCTRVIVVLSKSFLEVCRSYEGSKTGQLTSPSAYSDIAPMVLRWILNGEGFEHLSIVFVYFEFDEIEARKVYRDLLGLYPSAQNCRLKMQRSSILDSGQPASIPVHCQGRGCEESCLDTRVARFRSLNNGNPVSACRSDDGFQRRDHSQAQCAQHFPCSVVQSSTGIGSNDHAACLEADHCYEDHSCQDASIPHTSPPPYSTIDPNVNAVANCRFCSAGEPIGVDNPGINTPVRSCHRPASLTDRTRVHHTVCRTRHQSAPAKSSNVPNRPCDHRWGPCYPRLSENGCFHHPLDSCVGETLAEAAVTPPRSALTGTEAVSSRPPSAVAEPGLPPESHQGTRPGNGVLSCAPVSPGSRVVHGVSSRNGISACLCAVPTPSHEGPLSLRTGDGLRRLLLHLCAEKIASSVLSDGVVRAFFETLKNIS